MVNFKLDFDKITSDEMKVFSCQSLFDVEPWSHLDLSVYKLYNDIDLNKKSEIAFNKLRYDIATDIDVLDILALLVVENKQYEFITILNTVCYHWWQSILLKGKQQELRVTLLFLLQYHKMPNVYFANQELLGRLKSQLFNKTISDWSDKLLKFLVIYILTDNPNNFANIIFEKNMMIDTITRKYQLPMSNSFKSNANQYWWKLYFELSEQELQYYQTTINAYFDQIATPSQAIKQATQIFDHDYFKYKSLSELEQKTHKFGDIYLWLKKWNASPKFLQKLSVHHRQILRCWLGAGNYYQLEKAVRDIASVNKEDIDGGNSIILNRYLFWTNYQQHILDYYLLLPRNNKYQTLVKDLKDINIKIMGGDFADTNEFSEPIILLRFDKYYFLQPLREPHLIMTDDCERMDRILGREIFDVNALVHIKPCLSHDHFYLWQRDAALTLEEYFNIHPSDAKNFVFTPKITDDLYNPKRTQDHKERLEKLKNWHRKVKSLVDDSLFGTIIGYNEKSAISYHKRLERHGA